MEFNEMKMIWDSQNQEPLYAMNEAALHAVVQRKNQEWNCCLSRCFAAEITIGLLCGALMFVCAGALIFGDPARLATLPWLKVAASRWDILALLAAGGIWFYYSAYMFLARKRQQRRVEVFDSSLRGDLERALAQTDFQIGLARSIVWWGLIPAWVAGHSGWPRSFTWRPRLPGPTSSWEPSCSGHSSSWFRGNKSRSRTDFSRASANWNPSAPNSPTRKANRSCNRPTQRRGREWLGTSRICGTRDGRAVRLEG